MSTKFGIPRAVIIQAIVLENDSLPGGFIESDFIEIAFRNNIGAFRWLSDIAAHIPDDTKIYPLDNSAQGIFTIGDVRREIEGA